jgi:hypothetical protein
MGQMMWDEAVVYPFHVCTSFVNMFNFVNYITKWKNSLHMVHAFKIFKNANTTLGSWWKAKKGSRAIIASQNFPWYAQF